MTEPTKLLLPDDEHYYFGVELPYSPEELRERLLRKPEYLYSLTSVDEEEGETWRTWLYLWRCNEGWDMRIGHLSAQEQIAQLHARHNMGLHVVLHALTEDEALNPSTYQAQSVLLYPGGTFVCKRVPDHTASELAAGNRKYGRHSFSCHQISRFHNVFQGG